MSLRKLSTRKLRELARACEGETALRLLLREVLRRLATAERQLLEARRGSYQSNYDSVDEGWGP